MFLHLGKPQEAIAEFDKALERNTGRSLSLLGLGRAQEMAGNVDETQTWQQLDSNWRGDASELRELQYSWLTSSL
jgi:predicted Zn-dependent protease